MLSLQLLERCGTRSFSSGALYDPLWRFQENCSGRDTQSGDDSAANLFFNVRSVGKMLLGFDFRNDDNFLGAEIGIVHAHGNDTAIVNGGVAGSDLLNILRVNVFAAHDNQVFPAANDIQVSIQRKSKVAGVIPVVNDCLGGEVGAVVEALKQAVAFDENFADVAFRENGAGIGRDTNLMIGQQAPRRRE